MRSVSVPTPSICAPIASRQCARSLTSGSRAALRRIVMPRARVAAISRFSVPVTVTDGKVMSAPLSRPGVRAST